MLLLFFKLKHNKHLKYILLYIYISKKNYHSLTPLAMLAGRELLELQKRKELVHSVLFMKSMSSTPATFALSISCCLLLYLLLLLLLFFLLHAFILDRKALSFFYVTYSFDCRLSVLSSQPIATVFHIFMFGF